MASKDTITINGREYDAVSGLPVAPKAAAKPASAKPAPKVATKATPVKTAKAPAAAVKPAAKKPLPTRTPMTERGTKAAAAVHSSGPKRSQTLRRTAVKKPEAPTKIVRRPKPAGARHMDIARSTKVARFAPHPEGAAKKAAAAKAAATPVAKKPAPAPVKAHPIAKRAAAPKKVAAKQARAEKRLTAKEVKELQIQKALAAQPAPKTKKQSKTAKKTTRKQAPATPWRKRTIILTAIAAISLLAVFTATHIFPGLSVQVASIRSGVNASYPKYIPDGYSLSQPIRYSDGRIAITFKSNSNNTKYTLSQTSSSWDSTALLDNHVKHEAENNYVTTRERGLTIYTYRSHAAWVNGGILFTIEGDAELSGDQIRKIATSL